MKLLVQKMSGFKNSVSDLESNRIRCYTVLKDGRRALAEFSGYDRTIWRHINKRTGENLKKPVKEGIQENTLHVDISRYSEVIWSNHRGYIETYCQTYGTNPGEYEKAKELRYTINDVLYFINLISKYNYTSIEYVEEVQKPEEFKQIQRKETTEIINQKAEENVRDIAEDITSALLKGDQKLLNAYMRLYDENMSNIRESTKTGFSAVQKALKIAKAGGSREQYFANNEYKFVCRELQNNDEHDTIRIYDLMLDHFGVLNYCTVDIKTGLITG